LQQQQEQRVQRRKHGPEIQPKIQPAPYLVMRRGPSRTATAVLRKEAMLRFERVPSKTEIENRKMGALGCCNACLVVACPAFLLVVLVAAVYTTTAAVALAGPFARSASVAVPPPPPAPPAPPAPPGPPPAPLPVAPLADMGERWCAARDALAAGDDSLGGDNCTFAFNPALEAELSYAYLTDEDNFHYYYLGPSDNDKSVPLYGNDKCDEVDHSLTGSRWVVRGKNAVTKETAYTAVDPFLCAPLTDATDCCVFSERLRNGSFPQGKYLRRRRGIGGTARSRPAFEATSSGTTGK
jgi:hypothetical protein